MRSNNPPIRTIAVRTGDVAEGVALACSRHQVMRKLGRGTQCRQVLHSGRITRAGSGWEATCGDLPLSVSHV
jgi:hypothetical protein